ncbi:hypothetical protein HAX54_047518, partial [Datura stramonium]|nr:hypothetical protein [Datura stramonium]
SKSSTGSTIGEMQVETRESLLSCGYWKKTGTTGQVSQRVGQDSKYNYLPPPVLYLQPSVSTDILPVQIPARCTGSHPRQTGVLRNATGISP